MARPLRDLRPGRARQEDARRGTPSPAAGSQGPLIHLATRCESIAEFVEKFAGFVSENALVLPAAGELAVGTEGRFVIRLKDQMPAMRGRCRVLEVKPGGPAPASASANDPPRRTLMRVELLEMDDETRAVHRRLLAHKRPSAVPRPAPPTEVETSDPTVVSTRRPPAPPPIAAAPRPPVVAVAPPPLGVAPPPPLRPASGAAAFAPTLVGIPARPAAAPPPPVPPAFATPDVPTPGPTPGPAEARVPGAHFTLPANPLSGLESDDLASFIECTLFEAEAEAGAGSGAAASGDASAAPSEPRREAVYLGPPSRPDGPVRRLLARLPRPVRTVVIIAVPYAICTVIGVLVGHALRSPPSGARATAAAAHAPPPAAPAAEIAPAAPAPTATPTPTIAPTLTPKPTPTPATAAAPVPAPAARDARGRCTARIGTEPGEAQVFWGSKLLGRTPIEDARVPCGPGTVTVRHERYRSVSRSVTVEPGTPMVVSERLRRPPGTLVISSSPARARVVVNDEELGVAPRRLTTMRFERMHIEASLPGYLPYSKFVYLKEPVTKVNVQLTSAAPPPAAHRQPARPTAGGVQRPSSTSRSGQ